ncbi:MAG: glycosyltransferase family 2 protein [Chloroflexota bacterium]
MPKVSIIVPCYNEQRFIGATLNAIYTQTFPRADMEVVIADSHSTDSTREVIADFQLSHPDLALTLVDNDRRAIPSALNRALAAARGGIVVRMDAHSTPYPDYVENSVRALEEGRGDNVGGVWEIRPGGRGWMAESIAAAAAHPLGAGDAGYRLNSAAGPKDTVPFGAFRRSLVERIGGYDESLLSNEDYEFNARVRASGGVVWLEPSIRSVYYARGSLGALARQYGRYGFWKLQMLRRYPFTLRWRQALPPLFVASILALAALSFLDIVRAALILELGIYLSVLLTAGLLASVRQRKFFLVPGLPLAILVMHVAWGGGFLWSLITAFRK